MPTAEPHITSADVGRRIAAMAVATAGALGLVALSVAVYALLHDKAGGAAPVLFVVALAFEIGVFMPVVTVVHRLWRAGDARLRHADAERVARERSSLEVSREYERRRREAAAERARGRGTFSGG